MSLRLISGLLLGGALCLACAALFARQHPAALYALVFLLGGALVARLMPSTGASSRRDRPHDEAQEQSSSALNGSNHPVQPKTPALTARAAAVAADVPASELLEATMDSMREGVLVVDGSTRVLASNRSAREIFGGGGEGALESRRLSELTRHPSIHGAFSVALERGERAEVKVETMGPDRLVFDLRVAPLKTRAGSGGEAPGAIGVFFNITRLERLERVRQEFLSNVSHELRTPLTAIITFVETLVEGAMDDAENNHRFLAVIRRNAERMHNLIDDILELSAIEAGTVTVEVGAVALRRLVNDVVTSLASRASEQRVQLNNEVSADVVVQADARRLEQMLTNLVDNAIKFNRAGGTVTVGHERGESADLIHITDTGEGISPDHLARIFERFYRVDRARSRALGGTGLGLAIVKHLARAHGGEARVRSAPGQGSTFTIELPNQARRLAGD